MTTKAELIEENNILRQKLYDLEADRKERCCYLEHLIIKYQSILDEYGIGDEICKKRGLNIFGINDPKYRDL